MPETNAHAPETNVTPEGDAGDRVAILEPRKLKPRAQLPPRVYAPPTENYSRAVGLLKVALPLAALGILITVVIYSVLYRPEGSIAISYSEIADEEGKIVMTRPRFFGRDKDEQPFEVSAAAASQDPNAPALIDLDTVDARMHFKEEEIDVRLLALHGLLDTDNQILALDGPLTLSTSSGYEIKTDEARVDLKNGLLTGQRPITASGPAGEISADSFEADRTAKEIRFTGNVKMRLTPGAGEGQE